MKQLLVLGLLLLGGGTISAATPVKYVQISTTTPTRLQPGTTMGFYVSSGTAVFLNTSSFTVLSGTATLMYISTGTTQFLQSSSFTVTSATATFLNTTSTMTMGANSALVPNGSTPSSGTYLVAQGGGLAPIWTRNGRILQIQQFTLSGSSNTTGAIFVPTTLSGSFTPLSATSKVLIMVSGVLSAANTSADACATIQRNTSNLLGSNGGCEVLSNIANPIWMPCSMSVVDSPGTTSAVTYAVYIKALAAGTATWGDTNFTSTLIAIEIGQSP